MNGIWKIYGEEIIFTLRLFESSNSREANIRYIYVYLKTREDNLLSLLYLIIVRFALYFVNKIKKNLNCKDNDFLPMIIKSMELCDLKRFFIHPHL